MPRHTKAYIDLNKIVENYQLVQSLAPDSRNIAVVKADAYGHGIIEVAQFLEPEVPAFAVAFFEEAVMLREAGLLKPIVILQGLHEPEEFEYAATHDCWPMLHSFHQVKIVVSREWSRTLKCWIKVDVGLHRLGMNSNDIMEAINLLLECPWVDDDLVISSHFSHAPEINSPNNNKQLSEFLKVYNEITLKTGRQFEKSMANSASLVVDNNTHFEWNRPGMILYGLPVFTEEHQIDKKLKPAMKLSSRILAIRDIETGEHVGYGGTWIAPRHSKIATIAIGYADGYPRHARNGTPMLIKNQKAKLVGCVSMDMLTADITDLKDIEIGDEVELWGPNISAKTVAEYCDTISYELVTGLTSRVRKVYQATD